MDDAALAETASGNDPWNSVGVVYKSVDGGSNWTATASLGGMNVVGNIEGLIQTTGGGINGNLFISTAWNSRLYKSTDGGASWTFLANVVGGSADCMMQANNGDLYATAGSGSAAYIYRSTNSGATWPEVASTTNGLPGMVVMEFIMQTTNGTFFCSGQPGHVWRSSDGITWEKVGTNTVHFGGSYKNYSMIEAQDGSLYVSTRQPAGVYRAADNGRTWTQMANSTELGGGVTRCDVVMQTRCGVFFVGTDTARVYKSLDGDNWVLALAMPDTTRVNEIIEGPNCRLYIATSYPGNIYTLQVDTNVPVLPELPAGGDLGVNPDPLPSCVDDLMATDNCDGEVPVVCSAGEVTGDDGNKSQVFTYMATDAAGNTVSNTVTYTWREGWIRITSEKQGEDQTIRIQSVDNLTGGVAQYLDACANLLAQDWGCIRTNEATLPWPVTNLWEFDLLPEPVLRFFRIRQ